MRTRFVVRGIVQGVNFRNVATREASARGVRGRIWNRDDGAVEVIAEGDPAQIDDLARWLARGPRSARVENVERGELEGPERYREFTVAWRAPE
jgi:acylphosphatase